MCVLLGLFVNGTEIYFYTETKKKILSHPCKKILQAKTWYNHNSAMSKTKTRTTSGNTNLKISDSPCFACNL